MLAKASNSLHNIRHWETLDSAGDPFTVVRRKNSAMGSAVALTKINRAGEGQEQFTQDPLTQRHFTVLMAKSELWDRKIWQWIS